MIGWHHVHNGHELEQTPGQGSLVCCRSWGHKESDTTERLNNQAKPGQCIKNRDIKEGWAPKNWCFRTVVLEKTLESPLDSKEIKPVNPEGNQPWIFIGRTDTEAEAPILWPPDAESRLIGKETTNLAWEIQAWILWRNRDIGLRSLSDQQGGYSRLNVSERHGSFKTVWWWCCSVTKSCPNLCDPMTCSTPGFPVLRYLPVFAQTHNHWGWWLQPCN